MSIAVNEITILGAYGTKGLEGETSSFLLNEHNVIDAGNLLRSLKEASANIEAIWLTHSHLDHILDIAYILDSYFAERKKPLRLMGLPQTLDAIRTHFMNDLVWPDFSKIKMQHSEMMSVEYHPIEIGKAYPLDDGSSIEAFATDHTVPSCGYLYKKGSSAVIITADTYELSGMYQCIEKHPEVTTLVVECSFPSSMESLAQESKHLTPKLLYEKLEGLDPKQYNLCINHIKPNFEAKISAEIAQLQGAWKSRLLKDGDKIQF